MASKARLLSTGPASKLTYSCLLSQWPNYRGQRDFLFRSPASSRSLSSDNVFYPIINTAEVSLKTIHSLSHLPWWAVVISTTIALRSILTLPLAIHQNRTIARMELLLPTLKEYQEAVKHNVIVKCRRANLPVEEANRRLKKAVKKLQFLVKFLNFLLQKCVLFKGEGCGSGSLQTGGVQSLPPGTPALGPITTLDHHLICSQEYGRCVSIWSDIFRWSARVWAVE